MRTVLITGASGLIGRHLCKLLSERGYSIRVLGRSTRKEIPYEQFIWNVNENKMDVNAVKDVDYIIHLAGANISEGRWTDARKEEIVRSRVNSASLLFNAVNETNTKLKAFISSSAIGFYGAKTVETIFEETHQPGTDFIGQVCEKWEDAAQQFQQQGIRTVMIRTGVVLTQKEGPLAKMAMPVKLGIGSGLGKGSQYLPWIHIDDLCNIYAKTLEDEKMNGAYNGVGPEHISNVEFTKSIGKAVGRKVWFPNVPAFILKILFGEMAVIFLEGSRVSAQKIESAGFNFEFRTAQAALQDLLK